MLRKTLHQKSHVAFNPNTLPQHKRNSNFHFDQQLDVLYLENFYQNDLSQASLMFEVFLNMTVKKFYEMKQAFFINDLSKVKQLAHQMKPTFEIVGLTKLASQLGDIEFSKLSHHCLKPRMEKIILDFESAIPMIHQQRIAINNFLTSEQN